MADNKYLDLTGLQTYDALIKEYIGKLNDDVVAQIVGDNGSDSDKAPTIADIIEKLDEISSTVGVGGSEGEESILDTIEGIKNLLGELPAGTDATNLVEYIAEQVAAVDGRVDELSGRVDVVEGDVDDLKAALEELKGTGEGSVEKIVDKAIADIVGGSELPEAFDTLREIAEWLASSDYDGEGAVYLVNAVASLKDAVAENLDAIKANADAIDELRTDKADLAALNDHVEAADAAYQILTGRVETLEALFGGSDSDSNLLDDVNKALTDIENAMENINKLDEVLKGIGAIERADILALFGKTE